MSSPDLHQPTVPSTARRFSDGWRVFRPAVRGQPRNSFGFTLVEIMIVVVIIGLLAALAVPAFVKVRMASQDKAVLNNARQLASAADQYMMEHGVNAVGYTDIVGAAKYVKMIETVANESYPTAYTAGTTITVLGIAGARTITYGL
jgi:type IV pilus assembly protein PilA